MREIVTLCLAIGLICTGLSLCEKNEQIKQLQDRVTKLEAFVAAFDKDMDTAGRK